MSWRCQRERDANGIAVSEQLNGHTLRWVLCSFPFKRESKLSQTEGVGCRFQVRGENRCSSHRVKVNVDLQSHWLWKWPAPEATRKRKKQSMQSARMRVCVAYLDILCLNAVVLTDIMLYFGITRLNGPNSILVVILFEMGMGQSYNMMQN